MMPSLLPDAFAIAVVLYAVSMSMAKIFAKKYNYKVDANYGTPATVSVWPATACRASR